ncbi:MAG: hypothetical protein WC631_01325 [Candidatus Paceibacterota bacterium]|jgi:hypothetical protein
MNDLLLHIDSKLNSLNYLERINRQLEEVIEREDNKTPITTTLMTLDGAKEFVDVSALLTKNTKEDADLLAKTTKADSDLLAKITKASADSLAEETKASADILAEETKKSAEELIKSNEVYIGWTKWMTMTLILVGLAQMIIAIIPLIK